jgi:hypothetical protein
VDGWKQAGYEAWFIERSRQAHKRDPKQVIWRAQRGI